MLVEQISAKHRLPEPRVCRVLGQPRSTQRYQVATRDDEEALTKAIVEAASAYGRTAIEG